MCTVSNAGVKFFFDFEICHFKVETLEDFFFVSQEKSSSLISEQKLVVHCAQAGFCCVTRRSAANGVI